MDVELKLMQLHNDAVRRFIPVIREDGAAFLKQQIKKAVPQKILEIGTAIGYSGILMLANSNATLTTIDISQERLDEAKENFLEMGFSGRVECILGDAEEILSLMDKKFDFCFIDAAKGQYQTYFNLVNPMLQAGGTLVADNISYHQLVAADGAVLHKHRTIVNNLRSFLKEMQQHSGFDTKVFSDIGDGMLVMKKLDAIQ